MVGLPRKILAGGTPIHSRIASTLASSLTKLFTMHRLDSSWGRPWIGGTCCVPAETYILCPPAVRSQVVTVIGKGCAVVPRGTRCFPPTASTADLTASGLASVSTQTALKTANSGGSCACALAPAVRIVTVTIRIGPNLRIYLTSTFATSRLCPLRVNCKGLAAGDSFGRRHIFRDIPLSRQAATSSTRVGSSSPVPVLLTRRDTGHMRRRSSAADLRGSGPAVPFSQDLISAVSRITGL